ncbi:MAG: hypothetical protein ACHRXM_39980, partial [Isosphaerales bacterium]
MSIELWSRDRKVVLGITVEGWQFPASDPGWDAQWLVISGRVQDGGQSWSFRDPCLTMPEAWRLAQWLGVLANEHSRPATSLSFVEPNLYFELQGRDQTSVSIVVRFAQEALPPWITDRSEWPSLVLDMDPATLGTAGSQLGLDLRRVIDKPVSFRLIGYWSGGHGDNDVWPDPTDFVDPSWDSDERERIGDYLRRGMLYRTYMGQSACRICNAANGNEEYTDGSYAWPQGLAHYVIDHAVRLPQSFVDHVVRANDTTETTPAEV